VDVNVRYVLAATWAVVYPNGCGLGPNGVGHDEEETVKSGEEAAGLIGCELLDSRDMTTRDE